MFSPSLHVGRAFRVGMRLALATAFVLVVGHCVEVATGKDGPIILPPDIMEKYCIKEAALLSEVLAETGTLTSCISESTCDRAIDTEEEGYFETWHLYADKTAKVVLDADSQFDNLMQLALITEVTDQTVDTNVLTTNDDRSANDSRARIAMTFEATKDYLLRLSSFGDGETGCYTIRTTRVAPDDPLPEPPEAGSVEVTSLSTGPAPASYTVTLNGAKAKSVAANGDAMYEGIVIGDYAVELSNLGDCTVDGDNPQDVTVNADQTTTAAFELSCSECVTSEDCIPGGVCTVTVCLEGGLCNTETAEDRTTCDFVGTDDGVCESGVCEAATCDPPCTDHDPTDCTEPFCPEASTACDNRPRPADSDCQRNGKDGKCDSVGTCDICVDVDCTTPNQCEKDSTCNSATGTCNPFENQPANTECTQGGQVCDGAGNCVGCNSAGQCPDDANECTARACEAGQCGQNNVGDGTACDFVGTGDGVCESGVCVEATECGTGLPPCNDGNVCTFDDCAGDTCSFTPVNGGTCDASGVPGRCSGGACVPLCVFFDRDCTTDNQCQLDSTCNMATGDCNPYTNRAADTTCTQDGGSVCDGNGSCIECNIATQCPPSNNECSVATCESHSCVNNPEPDWKTCSAGNCLGGICRAIFRCTEQGIRDAIAKGGGARYTFDCGGPKTVVTKNEIVINNNVALDGEGNLAVDGDDDHRVFSVPAGVTAELAGVTVRGGPLTQAGDQGGGILNEGTLRITDSTVRSNGGMGWDFRSSYEGGGIYNSGTLTVESSTISENDAILGAGIYNTGTATLMETNVSRNGNHDTATASYVDDGSGIYNAGTLTLIDSLVTLNSDGQGDAAAIDNRATMRLINSLVSDNVSTQSAGILCTGSSATLINSTVSGNSGGIASAIEKYGGTLNLLSSSLAEGDGHGDSTIALSGGASLIVQNSLIVHENPGIGVCIGASTVTSRGGNIESTADTCGLTDPTDLHGVSTENTCVVNCLKLGPLTENGGPTKTHALLPGSVAIDRIPTSLCVDGGGQPLATDQRGVARPQGSACDVGAFEAQQ